MDLSQVEPSRWRSPQIGCGAGDQNVALRVMSPVAAKLEEVVLGWLCDLLGLPASTSVGFVNGATMANFTCVMPFGNAQHGT